MTKPAEGDPTRGIVDIDTFGYYVLEFRARMIANPPSRVRVPNKSAERVFDTIGIPGYQDYIENPHNELF